MKSFLVDQDGYYGEFGGAYVPEILHKCVELSLIHISVFFIKPYGHFMQINRIFAVIQPSFQTNRRLLKNRQESKSSLST